MNFLGIFVLAVLVEGIIEYLAIPVPSRFKPYLAAILAMIVCVAYGADLPAALGLPAVRYVGSIVTGLVIGRGSNYLADVVKRISVVSAPAVNVANVPTPSDERAIAERLDAYLPLEGK